MNYFGLVKRAFNITFKHRFLWILGMLVALTEGGINFNFGDFSSRDWNNFQNWWQNNGGSNSPNNIFPSSTLAKGQVLGNSISEQLTWLNISSWISNHIILIYIIGGLLILLMVAALVISEMARGGLIWGVVEINKGEKSNFGQAFKRGVKVFWKVLGLRIVFGLIILSSLLIYGLPLLFFVIFQIYAGAIVWGLIFLIPLVVFIVFIDIVFQYALRSVVIDLDGLGESMSVSWHLIKTKFKEVFLVWLVNVGFNIIIGLAVLFLYLILLVVLGAIVLGLYIISGFYGAIISGIFLGLIFIAVAIIIAGIVRALIYTYWTLAYLELTK